MLDMMVLSRRTKISSTSFSIPGIENSCRICEHFRLEVSRRFYIVFNVALVCSTACSGFPCIDSKLKISREAISVVRMVSMSLEEATISRMLRSACPYLITANCRCFSFAQKEDLDFPSAAMATVR